MFIKGKCAIYIDKNLRVYEKSTVIFVLWFQLNWLIKIPKSTNKNRELKKLILPIKT